MAEQRRLDGVSLTVNGAPLAAELYELLTSVRVEESVQLPDLFELRFDDPHFELFDAGTFTVGTRIEVAFRAEGDLVTVSSAEVTAVAVEQGAGGRHELVLSGLDGTHRLSRGPRTRSFLQVTVADIASRIADEHGLDADVEATGEVHDYLLQASESDYAFLSRLARRIGYDLWVTDGTLHFRQRPRADSTPPTLRWGDNLQRFKVRYASAERCDEVTVRGWDPVAKRVVVGRATDGEPGTTAPAAAELADDARDAFGQVARSAGQFPVSTQAEADALARAHLLRASGAEVVARGTATGDPLFAAGAEVKVEAVGERLSGAYLLTSVEHTYGAGAPYLTRFVCGGKQPDELTDLLGGNVAAAGAGAWGGLVVGVTTNIDDPEQLGRVKVKFPSLTDDDESTWARVVMPGAGPERGLQCLPEVGDEVLVGFELEDKRRPLVLGGLWNRTDVPPEQDAVVGGEVRVRVWKSREGHRLELRDERDGSVVLALGDGDVELLLTRTQASLIGEEIEVRARRQLTLAAPKIHIDGDAEVKITGGTIRLN